MTTTEILQFPKSFQIPSSLVQFLWFCVSLELGIVCDHEIVANSTTLPRKVKLCSSCTCFVRNLRKVLGDRGRRGEEGGSGGGQLFKKIFVGAECESRPNLRSW